MTRLTFKVMRVAYPKSSASSHKISFNDKENPSWEDIRSMIRCLEKAELRISLDEGDESQISIMIEGKPGHYSMVVIRGEDDISIIINPGSSEDSVIFILGDDCPKYYLVSDINMILEALRYFIYAHGFLTEYSDGNIFWAHD